MNRLVNLFFLLLATATIALCCGNEPRIYVTSPDGVVVSVSARDWVQSEWVEVGKCILTVRERKASATLSCGKQEWEVRELALDRCFTGSDMAFLWGSPEDEQKQIEKIMEERRKE